MMMTVGATTVVARNLLFYNFLPIPDAESLTFYPLVLKLVVCDRHRGCHGVS